MLENSLQDTILLWQEIGLDDHFHLSFLPVQAQVLETESYCLTLYLPFKTIFQLELLEWHLVSINSGKSSWDMIQTSLEMTGLLPLLWGPSEQAFDTHRNGCMSVNVWEVRVTHLFRLARSNPALAEILCSTVSRWLCLSYYFLQSSGTLT